jgi:predicted dehydrogenase
MAEEISRRELIGQSGRMAAGLGLAAAGWIESGVHAETVATSKTQRVSPNEKVVLGLIGSGGMGCANMYTLMGKPEVEVAAICDVDSSHLTEPVKNVEKKYGKLPAALKDFRRLLEMKEIDGVIIGTPDHWHALPMIMACEAGKDVYVEKPISHDIVEGQAMVRAARKYKRVVQVGTWQRSTQEFVDVIDYVRSGKLGKISVCRCWTLGNANVGKGPAQTPPASLDYDFWVGPARFEPYKPWRCHGQFRWFFNFAAGLTGDWGVHMIDIALLGMTQDDNNLPMPARIHTVGGKIICDPDDDRTTPDTQITTYQFNKPDGAPDWLLQWEVRVGGQGLDLGPGHGTEFIGQNARLMVWRNDWHLWTPDGKPMDDQKKPSERRVNDHWQNWLDCIKSRETPRSGIYSMYQTTAVCHLANAAYLAGESLAWDNAKQTITTPAGRATQSYRREYRKPWNLPMNLS